MVGSEVGDKVGLPGKYVGARVGEFEGVLLGASVGRFRRRASGRLSSGDRTGVDRGKSGR